MPKFEVVAPFSPAGDQPRAIEQLTESLRSGTQVPNPAGRDRVGEDDDPGPCHRRLRAADPGPLPQQDAGGPALRGAQAVSPPERRGVLRLVLRLLPAGSLRPLDRPLHREGRLHQRGHRVAPAPGHLEPDGAERRGDRRDGQRDLRPGRSGRVPEHDVLRYAAAIRRAGTRCWRIWSPSSTTGTTPPSSRAPSGSEGIPWRSTPPMPTRQCGSSSGATRSSGSPRSTRCPARPSRQLDQCAIYPAKHFVTERPAIERAVTRDPGRAGSTAGRARRPPGKLLEAQRLESRTQFDVEMLLEIGTCPGIENYSRHLTGRAEGSGPPVSSTTSRRISSSWSMSPM